jgi:cytochrome P450
MVLHPDVQAKAQADIDRVVGQDRLPDFDDRPALPYLDAILRETLRWHPVVPMGPYTIPLFFNYLMGSQASHTQQRQATSTKAISSLKVCIMLIYRSANDSDC